MSGFKSYIWALMVLGLILAMIYLDAVTWRAMHSDAPAWTFFLK